jgi:uncharacterized membrane protein YhaH (DUF805 family)
MSEPTQYCQVNIFSLKGRIGRVRYLAWMGTAIVLWLFLALGITILLDVFAGVWLILLFVLMCGFVLNFVIRRLNDLDLSGLWSLLFFVPLPYGLSFFVLSLLLLLLPGSKDTNRYGLPPPPNSRGTIILAIACLPVIVVLVGYSLQSWLFFAIVLLTSP